MFPENLGEDVKKGERKNLKVLVQIELGKNNDWSGCKTLSGRSTSKVAKIEEKQTLTKISQKCS